VWLLLQKLPALKLHHLKLTVMSNVISYCKLKRVALAAEVQGCVGEFAYIAMQKAVMSPQIRAFNKTYCSIQDGKL